MDVVYKDDAVITVEQMIDLYNRSTLGERRPVHRPDIFAQMIKHSNLVITAWLGDELVGISRSVTDFGYVAYLSDLCVDIKLQRTGIGRRLIEETKARLGSECMIVLLAAPAANDYYPKVGFTHHPRCWVMSRN
ncbi:MAG: GNAT family N-acetyltransferase [Kiritimatiellae bacterium]|nr:GNAT family N-acetyltransferase [Kiritimatiellia bacterium]